METRFSILCPQEPVTSSYPEPDAFSPVFLPSGLYHSGFRTKILYAFLMSCMRATHYVHLIFLDMITKIFGEAYIKQSFLAFCHLLPLRSTYSPRHPVLKSRQCSLSYFCAGVIIFCHTLYFTINFFSVSEIQGEEIL